MQSGIVRDEEALRGKRFRLSCRVADKRQSFRHAITDSLIETTSQVLVPESNDETNRFLTAFVKGNEVELVVDVTSPFAERGRVCIMRPDEKMRLYHLHVMSECISARLKLLPNARVELVTVPIDDSAQEESF